MRAPRERREVKARSTISRSDKGGTGQGSTRVMNRCLLISSSERRRSCSPEGAAARSRAFMLKMADVDGRRSGDDEPSDSGRQPSAEQQAMMGTNRTSRRPSLERMLTGNLTVAPQFRQHFDLSVVRRVRMAHLARRDWRVRVLLLLEEPASSCVAQAWARVLAALVLTSCGLLLLLSSSLAEDEARQLIAVDRACSVTICADWALRAVLYLSLAIRSPVASEHSFSFSGAGGATEVLGGGRGLLWLLVSPTPRRPGPIESPACRPRLPRSQAPTRICAPPTTHAPTRRRAGGHGRVEPSHHLRNPVAQYRRAARSLRGEIPRCHRSNLCPAAATLIRHAAHLYRHPSPVQRAACELVASLRLWRLISIARHSNASHILVDVLSESISTLMVPFYMLCAAPLRSLLSRTIAWPVVRPAPLCRHSCVSSLFFGVALHYLEMEYAGDSSHIASIADGVYFMCTPTIALASPFAHSEALPYFLSGDARFPARTGGSPSPPSATETSRPSRSRGKSSRCSRSRSASSSSRCRSPSSDSRLPTRWSNATCASLWSHCRRTYCRAVRAHTAYGRNSTRSTSTDRAS